MEMSVPVLVSDDVVPTIETACFPPFTSTFALILYPSSSIASTYSLIDDLLPSRVNDVSEESISYVLYPEEVFKTICLFVIVSIVPNLNTFRLSIFI